MISVVLHFDMKKFFLVAALALCISHTNHAQSQAKVAAIGFYNVENLFDTLDDPKKQDEEFTPAGPYHYGAEIYSQKLHNIANVISQVGTDVTPDGLAIMGMAEVENDVVIKDLLAQPELAKRNYKYCWFYTPDERGISTAMIYNPKYFKVIGSQPLHVPLESVGMKRPTRDILYVTGIFAGDTVHILVNHWPSKSGGEAQSEPGRNVAAGVNKRIVDSLMNINPNAKILIMGDLNDNPTCNGILKIIKAQESLKGTKPTDIFNPWIKRYEAGQGTERYNDEWNIIDQIMISGNWISNPNNGWKYYKEDIFNKEFLITKSGRYRGYPLRSFAGTHWLNGYSDHFPVVMYFIKKS